MTKARKKAKPKEKEIVMSKEKQVKTNSIGTKRLGENKLPPNTKIRIRKTEISTRTRWSGL